MSTWAITLGAVAAVYLVCGLGILFRRLGRLGPEVDAPVLDLTVRVFMPALILDTLLGNPRVADPRNLGLPPLVGFVNTLLGFAVGALVVRLARPLPGLHTGPQRRTFVLACGLYNYGYVAIPLTQLLFDPGTLGVLFVYNMGVELSLWTAGVLVLTGGFEQGWGWRLLNPPTLAVIGAVAANAAGLSPWLPEFVRNIIHMLGQCAVPVALILVGASVSDHLHPEAWSRGRRATAAACVVRMLVVPLLFQAAAFLLPLTLELRRVLVVQSAMPTALFTIVMARYFGGHPLTAVRIVVATSLVSLLTIPLCVWLGLHWLR